MIPSSITAAHIREAVKELAANGWERKFASRGWDLVDGSIRVPPKEAVRVGARRAGARLGRFWGGKETNRFLEGLGFSILPKL